MRPAAWRRGRSVPPPSGGGVPGRWRYRRAAEPGRRRRVRNRRAAARRTGSRPGEPDRSRWRHGRNPPPAAWSAPPEAAGPPGAEPLSNQARSRCYVRGRPLSLPSFPIRRIGKPTPTLCHFAKRRYDLRLPWLAARPFRDPAVRPEHEHCRGAAHIQAADQVHPRFRINLHVRNPGRHARHLGQDPPGSAAGRAERGRKLHQRRRGSEWHPQFSTGDGQLAGAGSLPSWAGPAPGSGGAPGAGPAAGANPAAAGPAPGAGPAGWRLSAGRRIPDGRRLAAGRRGARILPLRWRQVSPAASDPARTTTSTIRPSVTTSEQRGPRPHSRPAPAGNATGQAGTVTRTWPPAVTWKLWILALLTGVDAMYHWP